MYRTLGGPAITDTLISFDLGDVPDITPHVALTAHAGSAIAKGDPLQTGLNASKLAIAAFLVPYLFVFNPQMILIGATAINIPIIICTSVIGMIGIGAGLTGYLIDTAKGVERLVLLAGGLLMLVPGTLTDVIGLAILVAIFMMQKKRINSKAVA